MTNLDIPDSPKEFFTRYIPSRFELMRGSVAGQTSAGSVVFHVGDAAWHFRIVAGELKSGEGMADDAIVQVTVREEDFFAILVEGARLQDSEEAVPEQEVMAFRLVTMGKDKADLIRKVQGTVSFHVEDCGVRRSLSITPGVQTRKMESPDCRLEILMSDFIDMQTGKANPMQLTMSGKMKMVGNPQIPMALSMVFQ